MDYQEIREYQIKQRAKNVAETPWLILPGDNKLTRRVIKLSFIKDQKDPDKFIGIHAEVMYQKRKNQQIPWPSKVIDLSKVAKDFGFKFSLDSAQTLEVAQALQDAYSIGADKIASGKRTVLRNVGPDEVVVTPKNKVAVLEQLKKLLDKDDISRWLGGNIEAISKDLALARLYHDRKGKLSEFRAALSADKDETFWQRFLKENNWMFGSSYIEVLDERRLDIHHATDFPLKVEGGFMDIAEIKKPQSPFWAASGGKRWKYRNKYLVPHPELQGAIAQTTRYILQAEKRVDSKEYAKDHGGIIPLKPRGLIIHGRSIDWTSDEWEAFRLLNDELHTVQVITFDHLLRQAERMLAVMKVSEENPAPEELEADQIKLEDLPF